MTIDVHCVFDFVRDRVHNAFYSCTRVMTRVLYGLHVTYVYLHFLYKKLELDTYEYMYNSYTAVIEIVNWCDELLSKDLSSWQSTSYAARLLPPVSVCTLCSTTALGAWCLPGAGPPAP